MLMHCQDYLYHRLNQSMTQWFLLMFSHVFNMSQVEALPVTAKAIQKASRIDPVLSKVIFYTRNGCPSTVRDVLKP